MNAIPNIREMSVKANLIYEQLYPEISNLSGQYIAIDIDSGKYFLGETREQAMALARRTLPNKIMFVRRVGELEKVACHNTAYMFPGANQHACLL